MYNFIASFKINSKVFNTTLHFLERKKKENTIYIYSTHIALSVNTILNFSFIGPSQFHTESLAQDKLGAARSDSCSVWLRRKNTHYFFLICWSTFDLIPMLDFHFDKIVGKGSTICRDLHIYSHFQRHEWRIFLVDDLKCPVTLFLGMKVFKIRML